MILGLASALGGCQRAPADTARPDVIAHIVMKKWAIVPARIEVKRGQEVELVVSSADVEHGLLIRELGIREPVQPGEPAVIKFRAERSGTFEMRCSVLCGSGHDRMRGQLIVDP